MRKTVRRLTTRHQAQGLAADLADLFQNLTRGLFDTYRPELHYMRGPGPKWHAKHDRAPADFEAMPSLVRVRAKG
jgi:hypothetical protein